METTLLYRTIFIFVIMGLYLCSWEITGKERFHISIWLLEHSRILYKKKKKELYTKSGFVREIRKSEQPRQFSMIPHP